MDVSSILSVVGLVAIFILVPYCSFQIGSFLVKARCTRCKLHIASVKMDSKVFLSTQEYELIGEDRRYGGECVCSACWEELKELGFDTTGNWTPGATAEYLKNTPNFITVFISVGALIVAVIALLR